MKRRARSSSRGVSSTRKGPDPPASDFAGILSEILRNPTSVLTDPSRLWILGAALLCADVVLTCAVILRVPYTEIDWDAYMSEVFGVLSGDFDYLNLRGDTGPLVYPAGFVWLFLPFRWLGVTVAQAQWVFAALLWGTVGVSLSLFAATRPGGPFWAVLFVLSRRVHSIFVLRLFNDPVVNFITFLAVRSLCAAAAKVAGSDANNNNNNKKNNNNNNKKNNNNNNKKNNGKSGGRNSSRAIAVGSGAAPDAGAGADVRSWRAFAPGCLLFSLAVSVKMNALLLAPALAPLLLHLTGSLGALITLIAICGALQVALAVPFLAVNPWGYLSRAFELSRVFEHKWTVNWRFLDRELFASGKWGAFLLAVHLFFVLWLLKRAWDPVIADRSWLSFILQADSARGGSGPRGIVKGRRRTGSAKRGKGPGIWRRLIVHDEQDADAGTLAANAVCTLLFCANFTGICLARTLHYQFYSWYFFTLPWLFTAAGWGPIPSFVWFVAVEYSWNVYPSTNFSSALLQVSHWILLGFLVWKAPRITRVWHQ